MKPRRDCTPSQDDVEMIRVLYKEGLSMEKLSDMFLISRKNISLIIKGKYVKTRRKSKDDRISDRDD